jgi:BirA family biotin operon repressor/biotin-[acetyl-CoA-carboxylase] ligase
MASSVRHQIIMKLKSAGKLDQYVSGEALSAELNISRAAIWKHIKSLKNKGFKIESSTNKGYRLVHAPDLLLPDVIRSELKTKVIGRNINYHEALPSTNKEARVLAENEAANGTIIVAETQSSGRGRRGRSWESPPGGLWMTIVLRPSISPEKAPMLTLLTGMVVAQTIQDISGLEIKLKWPNDVRIGGKKVCGILTELSAEQDIVNYILVGLGINVNVTIDKFPKELRSQVTSISHELKHTIDRVEFAKQLLENFEKEYLDFAKDPETAIPIIIEHWRQLSDTIGRTVKVETITGSNVGLAKNIAPDGALIVESETGELIRIIAGDCVYLDQ